MKTWTFKKELSCTFRAKEALVGWNNTGFQMVCRNVKQREYFIDVFVTKLCH